jgi:hypothetical protein
MAELISKVVRSTSRSRANFWDSTTNYTPNGNNLASFVNTTDVIHQMHSYLPSIEGGEANGHLATSDYKQYDGNGIRKTVMMQQLKLVRERTME